jgi:predicted methyltransferase
MKFKTLLLTVSALCAGTLASVAFSAASASTLDDQAGASNTAITQAVANTQRPESDRARDSQRKPAQVLDFLGVEPGQRVLDMWAGDGYYSEVLSYVVGPQGIVVAYNNDVYAGMTADKRAARYTDGRLGNVEQLVSANNQLELAADAFDVVLFILSYHDIYYLDGSRGWAKVDRPAMLAEVFQATRSGGVVGVVDHIAAPDTDPAMLPKLHRIDPELIKQDFVAAGFKFDGQSEILLNPQDDLGVMPMLPTNRGKSSRAVLRFTKP